MAETHEQKPGLLSSLIAIAALAVLAVVIIWGLIHLATLIFPSLSSIFTRQTTISISAPQKATSGEAFTINWKNSSSEKGSYALLYQCRDGLSLEVPDASGVVHVVPCNASYTLNSSDNTVSITPRLMSTSTVETSLSVLFIPSATSSKQAEGKAAISIGPIPAPQPVQTTKTTKTTSPAGTRTTGSPADLSVTITSASVDQYGNATLSFDIANVGGSTSGSYYFEARLPTQSGYVYTSPQQSPLGPGDHVLNTLRFSGAVAGSASISVQYADANSGNNYASQTVSGAYGAYTQPTYYQNQQYYSAQPYVAQPYYQYQYNQPQQYYPYPQYGYYAY